MRNADIRLADHVVTLFYVHSSAFQYSEFSWSDMSPADRRMAYRDIPVLVISGTSWGDYVGSMYDRSNHRVLLGDGCRVLRDITGDYSSHALALTLPRTVVRRLTRAGRDASARMACEALADMIDAGTLDDARLIVCDAIAGLADYPVIDESDYSELEWEFISADDTWDTLAWDMSRDIENVTGNDDIGDILRSEHSEAWRAWFGDYMSEHNHYPYCEDAVGSIDWQGIDDDAVKVVADSFTATGRFPWEPLPVTIPVVSLVKAYVTGSTWKDR